MASQRSLGFLKHLVFLCFFLSGLTSLLYELTWTRLLRLTFGSSVIAITIVISTFFGGLALGSFLFGRLSVKIKNPFLFYGFIELIIGLYALLIPFILSKISLFYTALFLDENSPLFIHILIRILFSSLTLGLPTILMGGTLPLITRFMVRSREALGKEGGTLYAVNTLGAVCGTLLTGFLLIPSQGVKGSTLIGAILNLFIFFTILALNFILKEKVKPLEEEPGSLEMAPPPVAPKTGFEKGHWIILLLAALAGFTSLSYEVVWSRTLSLILGSTVYGFAIILTAFLVGLALGSLVISRFLNRIKRPLAWFAIVQIVLAFTVFLGACIFPLLPYWTYKLIASRVQSGKILSVQFIVSFSITILPTLCMGMAFPLALKALTSRVRLAGRAIGALYGFNTVGAILGSFVAGFFLIPLLTPGTTLVVMVFINFLIGIAAFFLGEDRLLPRGIVFIITLVLMLFVPAFSPKWDPSVMTSQTFENFLDPEAMPPINNPAEYEGIIVKAKGRLIYYKEGLTTMVTIHERQGRYALRNDGLGQASVPVPGKQRSLSSIDILLALLPSLFCPSLDSALVVGLGGGTTVKAVNAFPYKAIDVVELEPIVQDAMEKMCAPDGNPLDDPRVELFFNDARNFLLLTQKKYDMITSQPSHPWIPGASNLFTKDFLEIGKKKLKEGGVFCQWINLFSIDVDCVKSLVSTFASVFPQYLAFRSAGRNPIDFSLLFIGFNGEPDLDVDLIQKRFQIPEAMRLCQTQGIGDIFSVFAIFVWGNKQGSQFAIDSAINTDDNAYIEVTIPDKIFYTLENLPVVLRGIDAFREPIGNYLPLSEEESVSFKLKLVQALEDRRDWDGVLSLLPRIREEEVRTPEEKAAFLLGTARLERRMDNKEKAIELLEEGLPIATAPLLVEYGRIKRQMARVNPGSLGESSQLFDEALQLDPSYPPAVYERAWNYILEGYHSRGKELLLSLAEDTHSPYYPDVLLLLAKYFYEKEKKNDTAIRYCEKYNQMTPDNPDGLYLMGNLLFFQGQIEDGRIAVERAKRLNLYDMTGHAAKAEIALTRNLNPVAIAHYLECVDACALHIDSKAEPIKELWMRKKAPEYKEVEKAYGQAYLNPREIFDAISRLFEDEGNIEKAIKYLKFHLQEVEFAEKDSARINPIKRRLKELENKR